MAVALGLGFGLADAGVLAFALTGGGGLGELDEVPRLPIMSEMFSVLRGISSQIVLQLHLLKSEV